MKQYKRYMIIGAARSGIAACEFLNKLSEVESVILTDTKSYEKLTGEPYGIENVANSSKTQCIFGRQPNETEVASCECIVLSPGVPPDISPVIFAKNHSIKVMSEIEFANCYYKGSIIGITGTNGKTTTTTLTAQILADAGYDACAGGNIGDAFISQAENSHEDSVVALELSSFQLSMSENLHPKIAIITNLTPDHLDRHKTFENYVAAKANIFMNMDGNDILILNYDDKYVRALAEKAKCQCLFFSITDDSEKDAFLVDNNIYIKVNGNNILLADFQKTHLMGKHNAANMMCAALAAIYYGANIESVRKTLYEFNPVEHRIEYVTTKRGVDYINDSKGTNPDATIIAVKAMEKPTVIILGGYDKHSLFEEMFEVIKCSKVKYAVVIGQTAPQIAACADSVGFNSYELAESFEDAMDKCIKKAEPGDSVLLSPACASWDMFEDYEQRGRVFKQLAINIKE